jgi:hypothetical protein
MKTIACGILASSLACMASVGPANARALHDRHRHMATAPLVYPPAVTYSRPSLGTGGCLSQGPADRNPCDPWYFKKTDPNIGGGWDN